jgi:phospholipid/cholesterol/gamma-HCH transport system permease protein
MRVTQQIDALDMMGVNSANFLILPKITGLVFMIPMLVIFSIAAGIGGAFLIGKLTHLMTAEDLTIGLQHEFTAWFIYYSIIKSLFFAFIITSVASFYGYTVKGGSIEVGKASTNAVVSCSVLILFSDIVLTNIMMQ